MKDITSFRKVAEEGDFSLFLYYPVWKVYSAGEGRVVRNIKTGEIMGPTLELCLLLYDENFNKLKEPQYEEDCYDFVLEEEGI